MLKQSFLSVASLDLLDLSYLIGLRRSASRQTKITDFIKRDGVFQRFLSVFLGLIFVIRRLRILQIRYAPHASNIFFYMVTTRSWLC